MIDLAAIRRLSDIPRAQARARGDETALAFAGETLDFAALDRRSNQVANALIGHGVRPADRIGVLTKNTHLFFEVFFGAAKARACTAPANYRLSPAEIGFILDDAAVTVLFVGQDCFDLAEAALAEMTGRPRLIALDGRYLDWEAYPAWRDRAADADPALAECDDDDVLQLYTSGTTGKPKGVRLSNRNYRRFLELSPGVDGFNYDADETVLTVMPLFHVAGVNVSCAALAHGCRLVIVKDVVPAEALAVISAWRVAHVFLAPAIILMMLNSPEIESADLSSLRTVAYGASPIAEDVLRRAQARFGCDFVQFYGMTESVGSGTYLAPGDHDDPAKLRSCGRPWPGVEALVADADGAPVPVGEVGEILLRGDTVMAGYWNREDATAEAVRDGWLRTGDAGYFDADGYLYIHDRLKDMIITGGENVYPTEVENAIFGCPGVADVAVIGVPDPRWGEAVKAVVVAAPDVAVDEASVIAWAKSRIAGYKAPKSVDFVTTLPRNASGKVLRRELRQTYWTGHGRGVA